MALAAGTFGEKGSLVYDGNRFVRGTAVPVDKNVSTEGAGDALFAGFMIRVLRGLPPEESLALGTRTATRVIGVLET